MTDWKEKTGRNMVYNPFFQVSNLSRSLDEANQAKEQMKTEMADRRGPDGELKKKYREMEKVVQMKDETIAQLQKVVRDKDDQIQIFVQMQKTINKLTGVSFVLLMLITVFIGFVPLGYGTNLSSRRCKNNE